MASCEGHVQVVELLLKNKVEIDALDKVCCSCYGHEVRLNPSSLPLKLGQTPLHFACAFHANNVVRVLLRQGADLNVKVNVKDTVRMRNSWGGRADSSRLRVVD
jgi:ankyrin repeat protein